MWRLFQGTGTNGVNGASNQTRGLGLDGLADLLRAGVDNSVTVWDLADQYGTHPHAKRALSTVPRDKVVILTKTHARTEAEMRADLDRLRKEIGTDRIDIVLLHCMLSADWPKEREGAMAVLAEAKAKGVVRAHGVSCHAFGGEPGRNATVESFNDLWQERVLRKHNCPTLPVLKRTSERFRHYYHYEKPHRSLLQKEDGTRFPGVLRDRLWKSLRRLPRRFNLDIYKDSRNHLDLPLANGKVSFVRRVDPHGRMEVNGASYFVRRKLEGQYVVPTIFTHRKRLVIKHDNKIVKSFPFPIKVRAIAPLLSIERKKC